MDRKILFEKLKIYIYEYAPINRNFLIARFMVDWGLSRRVCSEAIDAVVLAERLELFKNPETKEVFIKCSN